MTVPGEMAEPTCGSYTTDPTPEGGTAGHALSLRHLDSKQR